MNIIKQIGITAVCSLTLFNCLAQQKPGAAIPWHTYEAEQMKTTGIVLGPVYTPYHVETESSDQKCVKLNAPGQFIEFKAGNDANSLVVRYSLPDSQEGDGLSATLGLYKNGALIHHYQMSSRYSHLYGKYPFSQSPEAGKPRNFYDEIRLKGVKISKGDVIRLQWDNHPEDKATYCIIDLVDLEKIAPPLQTPVNSLSVTDKAFTGSNFSGDYTEAFKKCIASAAASGKTVWIPAGDYKITGDLVIPSNVTMQGAGMWYTTLTGDEKQYTDAGKRVRIKGNGSNIHLADFAIIGKLNYRSDQEANDGIVGSYGENSTISRLWIEHTKVGMWIENSSHLHITGCRMRNTMADGINFCVGMAQSTIENCMARGTGDDCFALWPAVFELQQFSPGHNLITHCTGELPYLANGAAVYGGESNAVKNCAFKDITQGSAILLSTTFPTENKGKNINNNFSGTTTVENCYIQTSGGFDHEWDWRAAVEICTDKRSITGIHISDVTIKNSLSNGLSVVAKTVPGSNVSLANADLTNVRIVTYGLAVKDRHALYIADHASGSLTLKHTTISDISNTSSSFVLTQ